MSRQVERVGKNEALQWSALGRELHAWERRILAQVFPITVAHTATCEVAVQVAGHDYSYVYTGYDIQVGEQELVLRKNTTSRPQIAP